MATRTGIQLAYPFSEKRLQSWKPPYIVQPKLDGERCRALKQGERVLLLSSSEEIISSVPHINKALLTLPDGEYDGELYIHGRQQNYTHSIVSRTTNLAPNYEEVQYWMFDVITSELQASRLGQLANILNIIRSPYLKKVPNYIAYNHQELINHYDRFIAEGYEGFIAREINHPYRRTNGSTRSPGMMKFKPKKQDDYTIIDIYEAISEDGKPLNMVGGFWCTDDSNNKFKVGAGKLKHPERVEIWQQFKAQPYDFIGKTLNIEYQVLSGARGVPLFSRAVRILPA